MKSSHSNNVVSREFWSQESSVITESDFLFNKASVKEKNLQTESKYLDQFKTYWIFIVLGFTPWVDGVRVHRSNSHTCAHGHRQPHMCTHSYNVICIYVYVHGVAPTHPHPHPLKLVTRKPCGFMQSFGKWYYYAEDVCISSYACRRLHPPADNMHMTPGVVSSQSKPFSLGFA